MGGREVIKVSAVAHAKSTACETEYASMFIAAVINGKWRDKINPIRRAYQLKMEQTGDCNQASVAISELKRKLPAVMWAGVFSKREANGLKEYSGLLVIDLDHLGTRLTKTKEKLSSDPHVFACFVSPSGDGLKAVWDLVENEANREWDFDNGMSLYRLVASDSALSW